MLLGSRLSASALASVASEVAVAGALAALAAGRGAAARARVSATPKAARSRSSVAADVESGVVRARVEPGDRRSGLACLADASGDGGRRGKVDGDDVIGAASLWSGRRSDRIWFFDATMRKA